MKIHITNILAILVIVVVAAINMNVNSNKYVLSDMALANVEALAQTEWVSGQGWSCFWSHHDDLGDLFFVIVRCSDCWSTASTIAMTPDYCLYK